MMVHRRGLALLLSDTERKRYEHNLSKHPLGFSGAAMWWESDKKPILETQFYFCRGLHVLLQEGHD